VTALATGVPFQTKAEWVYAKLRERITRGELSEGERLRLTHLASEFETSEMPVREALRMLQRDGLVNIESHRGATVADVSWEWVYEAVMTRMHLEVLAVREATPHHDERTLKGLNELLDRMDVMAEQDRSSRFSQANRELHTRLYEPCPHAVLREEIQELWDRMWRTRSESLFRLQPERMREAQKEHRAIVEAVATQDAELAAERAEEHRVNTLGSWRKVLEPPPDDSRP
jgi:DNA-binding GntR family transcriptional regulator